MNMEMKSTGIHADNGREKGAAGEAERWKGWLGLDAPLTPLLQGLGLGIWEVSGVLASRCGFRSGQKVPLLGQEPPASTGPCWASGDPTDRGLRQPQDPVVWGGHWYGGAGWKLSRGVAVGLLHSSLTG